MLFHVTHTHTESAYDFHDEEVIRQVFGKVIPTLVESGVEVIGAWADGPAHQVFFVIEADSANAINDGLQPIINQGTAWVQPVADIAAKVW
jgi:hypothetical protein